MRSAGWAWGAVAVAIASFACGPRRHVAAPAEPPRQGRSSVRLLNAPATLSGSARGDRESITPAYASSENVLPTYPGDALRAGCADGVIPLRVYVCADGNVGAQTDIPGRPVAADSCSVAFLAAVESAVARWRFAPAFRVTQTPTSEPGAPAWHQTPIAIYLDYEFRFEVVDGQGVVRAR